MSLLNLKKYVSVKKQKSIHLLMVWGQKCVVKLSCRNKGYIPVECLLNTNQENYYNSTFSDGSLLTHNDNMET